MLRSSSPALVVALVGTLLAGGCGNPPAPAAAPEEPAGTPQPRAAVFSRSPAPPEAMGTARASELTLAPPPPLMAGARYSLWAGVPGATLTWKTSDPTVAAVDASGVVHGIGPGTATVTATMRKSDGSITSAATSVVVRANPLAANRRRRR